eukprot:CAMPEP_0206516252 /NCGR_PEP_ID=MMETSP0324_2-20121206/63278_1 /ASSEMBLY_ACC=CAM_ASM_000836 /TAXON_ID=2866 /ORGANISM="Crypthecodinium cohnii, Strain Seligo" /LENGTH=91 /DNA_ID=CAMNT_0054009193 /DNA_START=629 /DNA_END=901 /DNA_ORIENTATION=+
MSAIDEVEEAYSCQEARADLKPSSRSRRSPSAARNEARGGALGALDGLRARESGGTSKTMALSTPYFLMDFSGRPVCSEVVTSSQSSRDQF